MNDIDFANLVESIKQAGQIKKGHTLPSRKFEFTPLDIRIAAENPEAMKKILSQPLLSTRYVTSND